MRYALLPLALVQLGNADGNPPPAPPSAPCFQTQSSQWAHQLGSTASDKAFGVTTDATGDIYAVGWTQGSFDGLSFGGQFDGFIAKYTVQPVGFEPAQPQPYALESHSPPAWRAKPRHISSSHALG